MRAPHSGLFFTFYTVGFQKCLHATHFPEQKKGGDIMKNPFKTEAPAGGEVGPVGSMPIVPPNVQLDPTPKPEPTPEVVEDEGVQELPKEVSALGSLLNAHASDLDSIKELIVKAQAPKGELSPEAQRAYNRILATAAVAGIPTETQVKAVAEYCGLEL